MRVDKSLLLETVSLLQGTKQSLFAMSDCFNSHKPGFTMTDLSTQHITSSSLRGTKQSHFKINQNKWKEEDLFTLWRIKITWFYILV